MIRIVRGDENEQKLRQMGIVINAQAILGRHFRCEPPTCLDADTGVSFHYGAAIEAFSYVSGTKIVISNITIGRYCSIAADFSVRANHRMDLISTSPVFYSDDPNDNLGFKRYPFAAQDFKLINDYSSHPSFPQFQV